MMDAPYFGFCMCMITETFPLSGVKLNPLATPYFDDQLENVPFS